MYKWNSNGACGLNASVTKISVVAGGHICSSQFQTECVTTRMPDDGVVVCWRSEKNAKKNFTSGWECMFSCKNSDPCGRCCGSNSNEFRRSSLAAAQAARRSHSDKGCSKEWCTINCSKESERQSFRPHGLPLCFFNFLLCSRRRIWSTSRPAVIVCILSPAIRRNFGNAS